MNSFGNYGYDFYQPNDSLYFDEYSYLDSIRPLNKIENFENDPDLEKLLNDDTSALEKICKKKDEFCQMLKRKYNECAFLLNKKNSELASANGQIVFLYILLIVAIFFILSQRSNINNLQQMIYFLKWDKPVKGDYV